MKILAAVIAMISLTAPPTKNDSFTGLVMPPEFYRRLAQCETGSKVNHSTRSYTGMFGIYRRTWQAFSHNTSAKGKTPNQQAKIVDKIAFHGHHERGRYQHPVGLWGWGVVKNNCMDLQGFICRSKKEIVQSQKRNCK